MKINFVKTSDKNMASARYRLYIPAEALTDRGHEIGYVDSYFTAPDYKNKADYHIFGKHFNARIDFRTAEIIKEAGDKVVFDICDNHFGNQFAPYYRAMCGLADIITCNTPTMQEIILQEVGKKAFIVDDPFEYEEKEPRFIPNQNPVNLLWYGHFTNMNTIEPMVKQLYQLEEYLNLIVISNISQKADGDDRNVHLSFYAWNPQIQKTMIDWCNFVTIPSDIYDPTKKTKSHNRLVEGIRSGRFVLASPLPSYERFQEFAWIGEDFSDGIVWADENPDLVLEKIKNGQEYIRENLSPDKIAQQWEEILNG